MSKTTLLVALAGVAALSGVAAAETKLTTQVFAGSQNGFDVTSTLIAGDKEAILVDAQFTLAEAHRVVAMVLDSKKTLTTVYITHGHPDHYFGLEVIKAAFPKAKIVTPARFSLIPNVCTITARWTERNSEAAKAIELKRTMSHTHKATRRAGRVAGEAQL